jgi:radical SAM superfamily enzyme YgiQ (UPF0313 family)
MVGFTCYLWNIERTLWVVRELRRRRPGIRIVLGGPDVTADNAWVLETPDYDFAVIGEGEQTFAQLLLALLDDDLPPVPVAGLFVPSSVEGPRYHPSRQPARRSPLPDLNLIGSPYLAGILDAADEEVLLLETSRGCIYRCKFCYYWKSYDTTYYLADDTIEALQPPQFSRRSSRLSISFSIFLRSRVSLAHSGSCSRVFKASRTSSFMPASPWRLERDARQAVRLTAFR